MASITIERNRGICTLFYFLLGNVSVGPLQLCRSPEGLGRSQFFHTPLSLKPLTQTFQKPKLFFVVLCSFCALPQGKFHSVFNKIFPSCFLTGKDLYFHLGSGTTCRRVLLSGPLFYFSSRQMTATFIFNKSKNGLWPTSVSKS